MALRLRIALLPCHSPTARLKGWILAARPRTKCAAALTVSAGYDDECAVVSWEELGSNIGGGATSSWDCVNSDVVDSHFADASTYRMLVQRHPPKEVNIKAMRGWRDNVTRKLAPTVVRAFSNYASSTGSADLLDIPIDNDLLQHLVVKDNFSRASSSAVNAEPWSTRAPKGSLGAALQPSDAHTLRHSLQKVVHADRATVLALNVDSLQPVLSQASQRRRSRRGSGRLGLMGAGRVATSGVAAD